MTVPVRKQELPLLEEVTRAAAIDDEIGRLLHYLPDMPEEDPYQAGHRTCAGCGPAIEYRWVLKAAGNNSIAVGPTGCMYVANSSYLCTPYTIPWAHTQIGSSGSFTAGVSAAFEAMIRKGKYQGEYPNIIVMAGDGSAADIGVNSMSGALYRNHDALFICYDNEQYANTGIQMSSMTPYGASTTFSPPGKVKKVAQDKWPKFLPDMYQAGHPHCYVATTTIGYPIDLINKVRKGLNHKGAAYMHIYTPCQKGFVYQTPMSVELSRRVVECGLFPVWEWDPYTQTRSYFKPPTIRPVTDYLAMQGRFGHLEAEHVARLQLGANRNWEKMGVSIPDELYELAEPENQVALEQAEYALPVARTRGA